MKFVDIDNWNRRSAYEYFRDFDDPFFNITAEADATGAYRFAKRLGLSFSLVSLHCSLLAVNAIPELRLRIVGDRVAQFETVHATQTILNDDNSFSFCYFEMCDDVLDFERCGRLAAAKYRRLKTFDVEADRLDLVYYSVIPWVRFTSFKHATRFGDKNSVPRMVFGKLSESEGRMMLPHSVEAHHALADGLHIGRYFEKFQELLDGLGSK